jgi:hypothetical protein
MFAAAGAVISLIATAFVGTAAPSSASTLPIVQQVNAFSALDSTVFKSVRVFCPSGQQVIGTGYQLLGAEGSVVLDDLIPSQTSVVVSAGEIVGAGEASDGTTASWQIEATALCVPLSSMTLQIFSTTSAFQATPGPGHRTQNPPVQSVDCPGGTKALGMGASLSNGFGQVSIPALRTNSDGTGVQADGETDLDGYSGAWSITAYAICGPALAGLHPANILLSGFDSSSPKTLSATCPTGQVVLAASWGGSDTQVDVTVTGADTQQIGGLNKYVVNATESAPGSALDWTLASTMSCADGVNTSLATPFNLNGSWNAGAGNTRPVITENGGIISINMSAFGRPTARGGLTDSGSHIAISFPDDQIYTGTLVTPNRINWSNGTSWTKA